MRVTKISENWAPFLLGQMFYLYTCYQFIKRVIFCTMRTDTAKTIAGITQIVYTIDDFAEHRGRYLGENKELRLVHTVFQPCVLGCKGQCSFGCQQQSTALNVMCSGFSLALCRCSLEIVSVRSFKSLHLSQPQIKTHHLVIVYHLQ